MEQEKSFVPVAIGHYDSGDIIIGRVEYYKDRYDAFNVALELAARKAKETVAQHRAWVMEMPRMAKNYWGDEI